MLREREKVLEMIREYLWSASFSPLIRPLGTFSLEGEGFASLFETVDSATSGKPFVQNDMRVGWEWKKKQFIWVYRYQNARKDLLLFKSSNMNQSKIIACGINQKLLPAVSTAIANSININVPILRTSNWICRASTCKAFSVYTVSYTHLTLPTKA